MERRDHYGDRCTLKCNFRFIFLSSRGEFRLQFQKLLDSGIDKINWIIPRGVVFHVRGELRMGFQDDAIGKEVSDFLVAATWVGVKVTFSEQRVQYVAVLHCPSVHARSDADSACGRAA